MRNGYSSIIISVPSAGRREDSEGFKPSETDSIDMAKKAKFYDEHYGREIFKNF